MPLSPSLPAHSQSAFADSSMCGAHAFSAPDPLGALMDASTGDVVFGSGEAAGAVAFSRSSPVLLEKRSRSNSSSDDDCAALGAGACACAGGDATNDADSTGSSKRIRLDGATVQGASVLDSIKLDQLVQAAAAAVARASSTTTTTTTMIQPPLASLAPATTHVGAPLALQRQQAVTLSEDPSLSTSTASIMGSLGLAPSPVVRSTAYAPPPLLLGPPTLPGSLLSSKTAKTPLPPFVPNYGAALGTTGTILGTSVASPMPAAPLPAAPMSPPTMLPTFAFTTLDSATKLSALSGLTKTMAHTMEKLISTAASTATASTPFDASFPKELDCVLDASGISPPVRSLAADIPASAPAIPATFATTAATTTTTTTTNTTRFFEARLMDASDPLRAEVTKDMGRGFQVEHVFAVSNPFRDMSFQLQAAQIACSAKASGVEGANVQSMWHVPRVGAVGAILNFGMDVQHGNGGYFGRGLYFTKDPLKANDYSAQHLKGSRDKLRVILRCEVALGVTKEYTVGRFDRALVSAPAGFHSVQGFIRRSFEHVVYNNQQVNVTHVIVYRFTDPDLELAPVANVPPNVSGQVVFITPSLSEFFSKLQARAGAVTSPGYVQIRKAIEALLRGAVTPEAFVTNTSAILSAAPPPNLLEKLKAELSKCNLHPTTVGAAAGTSAGVKSPSSDSGASSSTTSSS